MTPLKENPGAAHDINSSSISWHPTIANLEKVAKLKRLAKIARLLETESLYYHKSSILDTTLPKISGLSFKDNKSPSNPTGLVMCLQGDNEGRRYRSNTNYPTYFDHVQGVKVFKGNQVHSPKCNHVDSLTETQTRLNIFFDAPSRDTLSVLHQQKISATQVSVFRFICMEGYIERAWCYP